MSLNPTVCNHGRVYVRVNHYRHSHMVYSRYPRWALAFEAGATVKPSVLGVRGRGNNWEGGLRVPLCMATYAESLLKEVSMEKVSFHLIKVSLP